VPIGISDDHVELGATFRKWAGSLDPVRAVRVAEEDPVAAFAEHSAAVAEMGLAGIAVPESFGGAGGTVLDLAVALEAAAGSLVPGPLLGTAVASVVLGELAGPVAAGDVRVALALDEDGVVFDAPGATHALVLRGDDVVLVALDDVALAPGVSPDLSRRTARADLTSVQGTVVPGLGPDRLRAVLVTLAAAEASGVAHWCLETAVAHAGTREQFGRPIGAFQAIKHLCAEMLETSESVTAAAWDAARAADEAPDQAAFAAAVAATVCFEGAVEVAKACVQVLGGVGFTFEHDAHLYLRRALSLRAQVGSVHDAAARLQALAGDDGVRRQLHVELHAADEDQREEVRGRARRIAGLPADRQRAELAESGYLAPHWPAPYGLGADPVHQLVIDEELAAAGVARPDLRIGGWAAPTILGHGTDQQRERFVGPTLRGEIEWCQLFSEPGAGSDLAALRTKAVRDGDGWRLTGQKVWTSLAHRSDWGICLARTDAEAAKHAGITYFLVDMTSEGIDVRPLRELTGESMFNEVFLDDVFVPDDCVVGEVNGGWRLARTTLANERVAMAGSGLGTSVERALQVLAGRDRPGGAAADVGRAVAWATVVKLLGTRATLRSLAGQGPGPESSVAKLVGVRSRQDSAELVVELLEHRVFTDDELAREAMHELLTTRCLSIAGGTTQVLRNVAGERILGLPRG
jgi:alkylation response protein AidB-like acyl-CoA dehydrogenase